MLQVGKFIAEALHSIDGLRVFVCWFGKIHALPKGEVSVIHAHHVVQMPILDNMIGTRDPVFIISHLLRIHLQSAVHAKLPLGLSWDITD